MSLTDPQAIRAIRYPERYGPRSADPTLRGGQSRARGLGRAILDTFPIVKFGSSGNDRESNLPHPKDIESARIDTGSSVAVPLPNSVRLAQLSATTEHDEHHHDPQEASTAGQTAREGNQASEGMDHVDPSQIHAADHGASRVPASPREIDTRMPECMGRETCPICIVDFEEGDDLRVLPCEGKHRFHQSCVDPWLLELSGSCPICRQGKAKSGRLRNRRLTRSTPIRFSCAGDDHFRRAGKRGISSQPFNTEPVFSLLAVRPETPGKTRQQGSVFAAARILNVAFGACVVLVIVYQNCTGSIPATLDGTS